MASLIARCFVSLLLTWLSFVALVRGDVEPVVVKASPQINVMPANQAAGLQVLSPEWGAILRPRRVLSRHGALPAKLYKLH
jgi:hypothetical protein